jgi:hypothetical protein
MKSYPILFVILSGIIISCDHDNRQKKEFNSATIVKDIPEWHQRSKWSQSLVKQLQNDLKVGSLENGFDSLQMRIWIECRQGQPSSMILLQTKNSLWNAIFYSFNIEYGENQNFEIRNINSVVKMPKSGWGTFSDSLLRSGITNLPDYTEYGENYFIPTDGNSVWVEIGSLKEYTLYSYPTLGGNTDIKGGPAVLHNTLKLIEKEFDFKRPCEESNQY